MANKQIDAKLTESKQEFTVTTGATITNAVRIAWDDTLAKNDIVVLIERLKQRVIEDLSD